MANGWTQRWRIASGMEDEVRSQTANVGHDSTGQFTVIDPDSAPLMRLRTD